MKWYKFNINDLTDEIYQKYFSLMSCERQEYTSCLLKESDRKRTVAGEMLARKLVAEICKVDEESIVFEKNEKGKPYAKNLDVNFSISHSGDFAVCAADRRPVGIDIEKLRAVNLKTAYRFCNENEIKYIFESGKEALPRFFEIWTAKEAAFKLQGGNCSDFKEIDTLKLNRQYFNFCDYTVCIIN